MNKIHLILVLSLTCIVSVTAQKPSKSVVDKMAKIIANKIKDNYVLADRGLIIADYFLNDLQDGRFYQADNLKKLDSTMTKSLREVSGDFHLYTWYNPEIADQIQNQNNENEETESTNFFNDAKAYNSNFGFEKVAVLPDNIGYIKLSQINISDVSLKKLYATMKLIEDTDTLIIDLRNNGGGGSTVGAVLETYFFDEYVELLEFRNRNGQTEKSTTVGWLLEKKYLKPLYLLVNDNTASAAEAFAFALQNRGRCTIIGQPTSGGAYMNTYFPVTDDFVVAVSTSAPFLPGTTDSWEGVGVQPDHLVDDELAMEMALDIIRKK